MKAVVIFTLDRNRRRDRSLCSESAEEMRGTHCGEGYVGDCWNREQADFSLQRIWNRLLPPAES